MCQNISFFLFDLVVPTIKITRHPVKDTVLEGTDVQINCSADGSPKPLVKWSNKYIKNPSTDVGNATLGNNSLLLENVTNQDEGTYECSANNRGGPVLKNVTLTVHGRYSKIHSLSYCYLAK